MPAPAAGRSPSRVRLAVLLGLAALLFAGFVSLGVWQIHRRTWKLALIAAVDTRVHAAPVPAPGPAAWPAIDFDRDAYLRVDMAGHFLPVPPVFVQAVTDLGPGFWVMAPFATDRGFAVLVNRGFVADRKSAVLAPEATHVTGLLRLSEPGGGFLRRNDPAHDRWFSRDVGAIAAQDALTHAAPYFVDAGAYPAGTPGPVGGLTVIRFYNNHLVYILTWFGLALMVLIGVGLLLREERRRPRDD